MVFVWILITIRYSMYYILCTKTYEVCCLLHEKSAHKEFRFPYERL